MIYQGVTIFSVYLNTLLREGQISFGETLITYRALDTFHSTASNNTSSTGFDRLSVNVSSPLDKVRAENGYSTVCNGECDLHGRIHVGQNATLYPVSNEH